MAYDREGEIAALKIILSNVVARLAITTSGSSDRVREMLASMKDECKLAAEHATYSSQSGADRSRLVTDTLTQIDQFFKGITIT
jgi:hypothetical protein